ncbi:unnamed protein product, partial [Ectocarpus fasciculatus]
MTLHRACRAKVVDLFRARGLTSGVILIKGGEEQNQYDTDIELVFRQDSWFNYLFGVMEPGFWGVISLTTGATTLLMPRHFPDYAVWCGDVKPPSHFKAHYDVEDVIFTDEVDTFLPGAIAAEGTGARIHTLSGSNSDSGLSVNQTYPSLKLDAPFDDSAFHHILSTARVTKSEAEIAVMHYSAYVASNAHVAVMRSTKPGMMEYELEARFLFEIYKNGGARKCAYTNICACGPNNAVLHYGHAAAPNDCVLEDTHMALLDMGADYHGYVSDITCSFPIIGKFTADQKTIFEGVFNAQVAVYEMAKPGALWSDCHLAAEREVLKALISLGVLQGDLDAMQAAAVGSVFMPHGLGHLIGCDTHDVGGYVDGTPSRHSRDGLKKLRTARALEANMVLTNEPGCYFIDMLLDRALANPEQAPFFNTEVLPRFRRSGGVRLEDVFVIRESGVIDNLTTCPRLVSEVESVMAGGPWP